MPEIEDGIEKTLVMIKPDAVEGGLVTKIQQEIEANNLKITLAGIANFNLRLAQEFYQWGEVRCPETVQDYLCHHPIALWIVAGMNATEQMMQIKLRLRQELCSGSHRNLLHCSSSQARFKWEYNTLKKNGMIE